MFPLRSDSGRYELLSIDSISQVQFGHRQFPQIYVLPCGNWVVTFCWTDDAYFAKSRYLRSTDQGKMWTEGGWATDSGCLVPLGEEEVGLFDSYYPLHLQGDDYAIQACFSTDGGRTFGSVELRVPLYLPGHPPDERPRRRRPALAARIRPGPDRARALPPARLTFRRLLLDGERRPGGDRPRRAGHHLRPVGVAGVERRAVRATDDQAGADTGGVSSQ